MDYKLLGSGAYGTVYKVGKKAVKRIKDLESTIQEYAIGNYLNPCQYTVDVYETNLEELTMSMKLYQGSLRDWMKEHRTYEQRSKAFRRILVCVTHFADRILVHGDLKPGNILCNYDGDGDITDLVLGDLGFVCIERFVKAGRTAPSYSEPVVFKDHRHDIYSLGVIGLQLLGNFKVMKRYTPQELVKAAHDCIKDQDIRKHIISCFNDDREQRPTSRYLLYHLYSTRPAIGFSPKPKTLIAEDSEELKDLFKEYGQVKLGIFRCKLGYESCMSVIVSENIPIKYHEAYGVATLVIFSSVFGKKWYTIEMASKYASTTTSKMIKIVNVLINNRNFLNTIFYETL